MRELGFAITLRVKEAVVNDPVAVSFGVVINQVDDADAFDDTVRVAAVLTTHPINLKGVGFIQHRVVKEQIALRRLHDQVFDTLPDEGGAQALAFQITVDTVVV